MMMNSADRIRHELEYSTAGELLFNIANRSWFKTYDGMAICAYCHRQSNSGKWVSPIIIAKTADAATMTYSGIICPPNTTFAYNGETYYVGQWNYSTVIPSKESTGKILLKDGYIFQPEGYESGIVTAALYLLDYYYGVNE